MDNTFSGFRDQTPKGVFQDANLLKVLKGHERLYPYHLAEQFPQIVQRIVAIWSSPEVARPYFQNLLMSDRDNRQGFPLKVYSELLELSLLYDRLFPSKPRPVNIPRDPWESGGAGRIR